MLITSNLMLNNVDLIFQITSDLLLAAAPKGSVTFNVQSDLYLNAAIPTSGLGEIKFASRGGDSSFEGSGNGSASINVSSEGTGGFFVPEALVAGYSVLRAPTSYGYGVTSRPGDGDVSLKLTSIGGEGRFGFGTGTVKAIEEHAEQGLGKGTAEITSIGFMFDMFGIDQYSIVWINSSGEVTCTLSGSIMIIQQIIESLGLTGTFATEMDLIGGIYEVISALSSTSVTRGTPILMPPGGGDPYVSWDLGVDDTTRVWVVNADTGAHGQYDGYGFNSFFEEDGKYYGVADDGIYLLEGDDDNGKLIEALADFGKSTFGSPDIKKIPNIYLGVSSDEKMFLKVDADGAEYVYELRSNSTAIKQHRADTGKGLKGVFWNIVAMNQEGSDFVLATVNFTPVSTKRKI